MKKLITAVAVLLSATAATAAEGAKIGVGALVGDGRAIIAVPINVAPALRVEPFLGLSRHKVTDATDPAGDFVTWDTRFDLGAGVYLLKNVGANVELYGGGRIEVAFISEKWEDKAANTDGSDSFNGFGLAAVGGAEYYFSPRFALGVEAELGFRTEEGPVDVRTTDIGTATFVTAKVFFQ